MVHIITVSLLSLSCLYAPLSGKTNTHQKTTPVVQKKKNRLQKPGRKIVRVARRKHSELLTHRAIRVLLEEFDAQKTTDLHVTSKNGFIIQAPFRKGKRALVGQDTLEVKIEKKKIYIKLGNNDFKPIKYNNLVIATPYKRIKLNEKSYEGVLHVQVDEKTSKAYIINRVGLEDYIYSVLRSECIPSWPLEMQKIQAIVSRSYGVYQINRYRPKSRRYDIKNSTFNQLYNGHHGFKHLRQAVQETKNIVLTHKGRTALAMFDIACGGIIPAHMKYLEDDKPYLSRKHRCTFCRRNKSCFVWKEDLAEYDFVEMLRTNTTVGPRLRNFGKLKSVRVVEHDKSGIARKIKLVGTKKSVVLSSIHFKSSIKNRLKSLALNIKKIKDRIVISGRGFGHHKGLCQCGARELVARGWKTQKILKFYFPQTKLSRLKS